MSPFCQDDLHPVLRPHGEDHLPNDHVGGIHYDIMVAERQGSHSKGLVDGELLPNTPAWPTAKGHEVVGRPLSILLLREPLWVEALRVWPVLWVQMTGQEVEDDDGVLFQGEAFNRRVALNEGSQTQRCPWVQAQGFLEDHAEVAQSFDVREAGELARLLA